jgi:alpha-glucosidase
VRYLAPDLVRITWQPGRLPLPYALARTDWPTVPVTVTRTAAGITIASDQLQVALTPDETLTVRDERGQTLRTERLPWRRRGEWQHIVPLREEEHLYGLGEHAKPFNLRGSTHYLWNSDPMRAYRPGDGPLYMPLPVYLSLHHGGSHLVFYENPHPAHFDIDDAPERAGLLRATFSSGALRSYIVPGPPARAYARYAELTGHPAMPPRWALGYHQSRFSYQTEQEVIDVIDGFAEHDLPISAIHLDIHYMQDFHVFTVNRDRFPDLRGLADWLRARNINLVTIIDPAIKRDINHWLYREGLEQKAFCMTPSGCVATGPVWPGWCAFPDFSDPRVRAWWGSYYQVLLKQGVAGFWHDMNEPTITATWGQHTLAGEVLHSMEGRGGDHLEAHNQYALLMAHAGYEALRREQPDRRPWLLSRSGWVGLQRYSWNWTGDISGSWATLRQTVQTVLGLSLSGIPYTGPDIGGFTGHPSAELFVRWFQLGALLPFFRTHSSLETPRREPWTFGDEVLAILREALRLRERLLPYYYTLAWQTHQTGLPLLRPLFWNDPTDPALWESDDVFLLGDALLVAPVLHEGATERTIARFPPGEWYHFWDDCQQRGGETATVAAPLERLPLFVGGGHMLPLSEAGHLTLHLYGAAGRGEVYTDAGDGAGDWRIDQYRWETHNQEVRLSHEHTGAYPPPDSGIDVVAHGIAAEQARLNDHPLEQVAPGRWRVPYVGT